ncbi:MAG: hypothetical protein ABH828_02910 [archaeon]
MIEINKFISQFTDKQIPNIEKIGKKYFLVSADQKKLSKDIGRKPFSAGIFLGEQKRNFQASPALVDMIAKLSDRKAFINKEAEWLFLCGRDVFEKNIVKKNVENGIVLVQNEEDENLGFGKLSSSGVKNILDKGEYLRTKN